MTITKALIILALASILGLLVTSCGEIYTYPGKYRVTLYGCSGQPIRYWDIDGKAHTAGSAGGWWFYDKDKLVTVSGPVTIEQL